MYKATYCRPQMLGLMCCNIPRVALDIGNSHDICCITYTCIPTLMCIHRLKVITD